MIRLRDARLWTSVLAMALAAGAIKPGATLLSFGLSESLASYGQDAETRLRPFADDPGVDLRARRDLQRLAPKPEQDARLAEIEDIVTLAPASGGAWLDLSNARSDARVGPEGVLAALALSSLVGPNEAHLMAGRGAAAASLWSDLPPESRRRFVSDLLGGKIFEDHSTFKAMQQALATLPVAQKQEIRAALLLTGRAGEITADGLGLGKDLDVAPENRDEESNENGSTQPRARPAPTLLRPSVDGRR